MFLEKSSDKTLIEFMISDLIGFIPPTLAAIILPRWRSPIFTVGTLKGWCLYNTTRGITNYTIINILKRTNTLFDLMI